jgi:hypothetical protein
MSVQISYNNKIDDIDDYFPGSLLTIAKPGIEHVIRFYHRKDVPVLSTNKETFGPFLSDAIKDGSKFIQDKLKPQYKNTPLWFGFFTGPNMPEDMIIRVAPRMILNGIATEKELFKELN